MTDLLPPFLAAWTGGFAGGPHDAIALDDLPALPLARTVKMPEGHAYDSGALSLCLRDLMLSGASRLDAARCTLDRDGTKIRLSLALAPLALTGRYEIMAKPDPVVPIDSAGGLMDLTADQLAPVAAGQGPGDPPMDPEKEQWLDNAREQRKKLAETENGQKLLGTYGEHNATYEEIMRNPTVATNWQANGATREMARDTHEAVPQETQVVNSASKTYGADGVTYNGNSFAQQLQIGVALILKDPTSQRGNKQPAPDSKYWKAAKAALAFGKGVNTTGNTKSAINEMTSSHVFGSVDSHSGDAPHVGDDEAWQYLSDDDTGGGRDARLARGWIVMDDEDRARMLRFKDEYLRDEAANNAIVGETLFAGGCSARIEGGAIALELSADDGAARVVSASIDLPAFDFDIDDSRWSSNAGEIARQRLNRLQFVRTLLREAVVNGLQKAARAAAERVAASVRLPI